jgi:hypothetical protein
LFEPIEKGLIMSNKCSARQFAVVVFLAFGSLILLLPTTKAVVIRHDRSDEDALRLGKRFNAVGSVLPDGGCTLIAPTWIITAAHVAAQIPHDGQIRFGDKLYTVKRVFIHPEGAGSRGVPPEVDLALVELAEAVKEIKPVDLYRGHEELGKTVFVVGYGDYGNPQTGLKHSDGRRRAVTNVVDDAGPRRIFLTFDAPPKGTEYEGIGAPGDSGGPAIAEQGDKLLLVGVSSASMNGRPGQYGVTDVYTRVGSYIDWIKRVMNH